MSSSKKSGNDASWLWDNVMSRWNENLSDRRFFMDVEHVLTLHHSHARVPGQPVLREIITTITGVGWSLGRKSNNYPPKYLFLACWFCIDILHVSIDPVSHRADLGMLTLKSFVQQMSEAGGFIDLPLPLQFRLTPTMALFALFFQKRWHAESVSSVKWQPAGNFEFLWSVLFKVSSYSETGLGPDMFSISSSQSSFLHWVASQAV